MIQIEEEEEKLKEGGKKKNWHESKFLIVKWMKGTTILCEHNFCIDLPNHLFNASFDDVYASRQFNGFP